jgi:hypothetical protein
MKPKKARKSFARLKKRIKFETECLVEQSIVDEYDTIVINIPESFKYCNT